jgi:hypothetical protein
MRTKIGRRLGLLEVGVYAWTVAALEVHRDELVVTLTGLERLAAMRREVRVPLGSVRSVCADPDPWGALRGIRAPGTGIPGVLAYGVRRLTGTAPDFVAVHGRGPAVRVDLAPEAPFSRLLITVADARSTVAAVRAGVTPTPGA